ncbi:hypothetical protein R1flu_029166 [Riccia fluitans]|uniref:Uncharacterized protein n=1 Tax=Riccia fluitans TaxID=41844 RepID=A0ABD1XPE6_9MARC
MAASVSCNGTPPSSFTWLTLFFPRFRARSVQHSEIYNSRNREKDLPEQAPAGSHEEVEEYEAPRSKNIDKSEDEYASMKETFADRHPT